MSMEKNAQPFYFPGGKTGCLLVHGFTGSPVEMLSLGKILAENGNTVVGVLLAGHGKTPAEMRQTRWPDWYRSVEEAYTGLRESCEQVFAIGLSMGGVLCLYGAARLDLQGVVSICAPVYLAEKKAWLAPFFRHFIKYYPKKISAGERLLNKRTGRFTYDVIPLQSLASFLRLVNRMSRELPQVKVPALIMQSRHDKSVLPESATYIYRCLGSKHKRLVWLEKSGHLATIDCEQEKVFSIVQEFVQEHRTD